MRLKAKIFILIVLAVIISVGVVLALLTYSDEVIYEYLSNEEIRTEKTDEKVEELQTYINENELSTGDNEEIASWFRKNGSVYAYIFDEDGVYYESSDYYMNIENEMERSLVFRDKTVSCYVFYDVDIYYYIGSLLVSVGIGIVVFFIIILTWIQHTINDVVKLENDINILEGGSLEHRIRVKGNDEIASLGRSLDNMRLTLKGNMELEEELRRANSKLITGMAHDLRTPLTSLLLYLELMDNGKYSDEEELKRYISKARDKAKLIQTMSDNLFEQTKVPMKGEEIVLDRVTVKYAFEDVLSCMITTLEANRFSVNAEIEWPNQKIKVSGEYIDRIMENISSNILKYADRNGSVSIELAADEESFAIKFVNRVNADILSSERSGVGLRNIEFMMGRMGGKVIVDNDGKSFSISIAFPLK